ncbi:MAG: RHS repeat-associated core domain-containing protein, partial [Ardenticatenaceae bacterium]
RIDGSGARTYAHADGLGSIRSISDSTGVEVGTREYDAFGATRGSTGVSFAFGFTGEHVDAETGFVYLRARYMDPGTGRFIGKDPYAGELDIPDSLHKYSYVYNSPLSFIDPSGLCAGKGCSGGGSGARGAGGGGYNFPSSGAHYTIQFSGAAPKAAARAYVQNLNLPQAQLEGVNRAISRASNNGTVAVAVTPNGTVIVHYARPGASGYQVMTSYISPSGVKSPVIQRAYDASGRLIHCDRKK